MGSPEAAEQVLRFGIFELDAASGELRRNGSVLRVAPQPFQVLLLLVRNAGDVVTRQQIRDQIWGGTVVDFDRSLNVCIAQIRGLLNDDADNPRFIQTLPRRGYRFLASVEGAPVAVVPVRRGRRWIFASVLGGVLLLGAAAAGYRMGSQPEQAIRLAVLPFDGVGLDDAAKVQVEGIFDELLTSMAGVQPERLAVIGRRSVTQFRGGSASLKAIGQQLNAPYAIEGTIQKEAAGIRVAVRLARTAGDTLLWSETFEQNGDPAGFEEQVVARVSAAVLQKLLPDNTPVISEGTCRDGWEAYRTGTMLAEQGNLSGLEKSVGFLEKANCAPARGVLADIFIRLAKFVPRHFDYWERARATVRGLDTTAGHLAVGNLAFWHDWNWKAADRELRIALRRNPSNPDAHHDLAWLLVATGRPREAIEALDRALALDPLSARTHMDAAWILLQAGRFDRAATEARRALELDSHMPEARTCIARALLFGGDERGAVDAIRPSLSDEERQAITGVSAREALLRILKATPALDPYERAWRFAYAGAKQDAISALEEAFHRRNHMTPLVAVDPAFAALRTEPRYQKIVHDLGL